MLAVLMVGSPDLKPLGFYMKCNKDAKSLTSRRGFRSQFKCA